MKKERIILTFIGYLLLGISTNMLLVSKVALHPMSNVNKMIEEVLPPPFDSYTLANLIVNAVILALIFIFNFKFKAPLSMIIKSVISLLGASVFIFAFELILADFEITSNLRYVTFVVFFFIFMFGIYLFTIASVLTPTMDYFVYLLSTAFNKSLGYMRNLTDLIYLAIALSGLYIFKMQTLELNIMSIFMALSGGNMFRLFGLVPYFKRISEEANDIN